MSSTKQAGKSGIHSSKPQTNTPPVPQLPRPSPFVPHPRAFIVLCVLFAVWVGFLVTLYFTTIYPRRYPGKPASVPPAGRVITQ